MHQEDKKDQIFERIFTPAVLYISDRNGKDDTTFVVAGSNDTDVECTDCAMALLTTPGFKGNEHPRECLNFWYNIKVNNVSI